MDEGLTRTREEREEEERRTARRRGRLIIVALALLLGSTAYTGLRQLRGSASDAAGASGIADYAARETGERRPMPSFSSPELRGGEVGSALLRGKVAVVNIWASWCGPCRKEAPGLQRLWEEYQAEGVQFLGVDFQDDRYAAQAFEDEFGLTYPSAFDPSGSLAAKFQVLAVPTTFLISRDGWIEHQYMGIVSEKVLRDLIEEQLGPAR
jgi:DsbE subfamily thiol:disulfide oxidoreductase